MLQAADGRVIGIDVRPRSIAGERHHEPGIRIYCRIIEIYRPRISHSKWQYYRVPAPFSIQRVTRQGDPDLLSQLESIAVHDLPRLSVTKRVDTPGQSPRFIPRDFKRLSLGQQQSVLLALMLTSDSRCPLIVDQPEDNLDSEFIYKTLVPVIRSAKERRQIIVVTHNANIAVLGDAELIVILKATNDKGMIAARGSIDEAEANKAACEILRDLGRLLNGGRVSMG
jgi:ABC-type hemin transport system ATPase subunit